MIILQLQLVQRHGVNKRAGPSSIRHTHVLGPVITHITHCHTEKQQKNMFSFYGCVAASAPDFAPVSRALTVRCVLFV